MATLLPRRINITEEILKISRSSGMRVAIQSEPASLNCKTLAEQVEIFASVLKDQFHVKKGDTILIRAMNLPEIAVSVLSCMMIGAIPCMTSRLYMRNELRYALENSRAEIGITPAEISLPLIKAREETGRPARLIAIGDRVEGAENLSELLKQSSSGEPMNEPTEGEDPAFVMYTSGSTGSPKGVVHAHRWLLGSAKIVGTEMLQLTPDDVVYCPQEISFLHGFAWGFIAPLYFGSSIVLLPARSGASPESFFEILEKYRVTVFVSVTTMFRNLLRLKDAEKKYDLSSLRMCVTSGDSLYPKEFEEWRDRFKIDLVESMAQTEIGIYTGYPAKTKIKPGSCGVPLAGHNVKILDDNSKEASRGSIGHLVISETDPGLFKEYLRMPDVTKGSRKDGWYYTKDMGFFDEEGYLWYAGRSDDMFKSRGYLISPQEIEKVIMEHPAVQEACVIGAPDEIMGNRVRAFICLKPGNKKNRSEFEAELRNFLLPKIATYKVPKEVEIIEELPKTITGKIKRSELRTSSNS
ncbi:MAG TPA: class I adenylate-forming enzyme family protein [Nitrososphaerales archaeon]|nr:class I adenylate-forming enzyme family protein [Nitrososphaerales archaeon]